MRATITYGVEVDSVQKLTALREKAGQVIDEDPDVTLIAANSAVEDEPFTVVGSTRGKPDEPWTAVVHAQDAEEAKEKALAEDDKRAGAQALPGVVEPL